MNLTISRHGYPKARCQKVPTSSQPVRWGWCSDEYSDSAFMTRAEVIEDLKKIKEDPLSIEYGLPGENVRIGRVIWPDMGEVAADVIDMDLILNNMEDDICNWGDGWCQPTDGEPSIYIVGDDRNQARQELQEAIGKWGKKWLSTEGRVYDIVEVK